MSKRFLDRINRMIGFECLSCECLGRRRGFLDRIYRIKKGGEA